jgi:small subunit ribosomal protein S4
MIIGPKFKICRRLGSGVFDKCQTQKYMLSEGKHSKVKKGKRRKQITDYGKQLIEKQKVRFTYGVQERQFVNYVRKAENTKGAIPSEKLNELLERRLDNVIYRSGMAKSRPHARQMVTHGHFMINDRRTNVPSRELKNTDVITVREGSKDSALFQNLASEANGNAVPKWLSSDLKAFTVKVTGLPKNEDSFLNLNTVIEFYSR